MRTEPTARSARQSVELDAARRGAVRRRWLTEVGWKYLVALVILFYALFPLVYVLSASFNPGGNLAASNTLFAVFDLGNYTALSGTRYWTWYGNTLIV
ncbi:MAG: sugar ABC transporter permease, partial [Microbacterium sp.]